MSRKARKEIAKKLRPEIERTQLTADIRRIQAAEGPEFPWWCDLEYNTITNVGPSDKMQCSPGSLVHCPPAVADAVVMYAQRLADAINDGSVEFDQVCAASIHYHSDELRYSWSVRGWPHKCDACGHRDSPAVKGEEGSRLSASLALISAVAGGLEEE